MYYTVIKHSSHLRTLEKCRKHSPAARAFHISLVFSNACRVLSQCNTRLRLLYLLISRQLTPLLLHRKIKFENSVNAWGNYRILYHKTNKEASTELCSVVKHLGSGRALKKWGKTLDCVSCFPLHFFRALPLPACFTTEQSAVEASLFVKCVSNLSK